MKAIAPYPGPVLIVHGSEDASVPAAQAHTYHQARTASSKPTRLEILDGADHTFNSLPHTEKVCDLLGEFCQEHLAARQP